MTVKCKDKVGWGSLCARDCLPGMTVCVHHATKEAMAEQMRRAAARETELTTAMRESERLLNLATLGDTNTPRLAADYLRVALRSSR